MIPDLSWLAEGDRPVVAGMVGFCLLFAAVALLARAERQIRGGVRRICRWVVRGARWAGARWDAWHAGCPECDHCHPDTARTRWAAQTAGARHAAGTHYIPARTTTPGDTR